MAAKLCKEQQISFSNSTKYSHFIDGKYFFEKLAPYCSKKIASSKKKLLIDFLLKFLVSAYIDMINMSEKFQEIVGAEVRKKKPLKIQSWNCFKNFKNKLLSSRRSHQFEFSGQVNSIFANCENKSRLRIVLFFKRYFLVF